MRCPGEWSDMAAEQQLAIRTAVSKGADLGAEDRISQVSEGPNRGVNDGYLTVFYIGYIWLLILAMIG